MISANISILVWSQKRMVYINILANYITWHNFRWKWLEMTQKMRWCKILCRCRCMRNSRKNNQLKYISNKFVVIWNNVVIVWHGVWRTNKYQEIIGRWMLSNSICLVNEPIELRWWLFCSYIKYVLRCQYINIDSNGTVPLSKWLLTTG